MSRRSRRSGQKRSYRVWIIVALVVVTGVVGYYIFSQGTSSTSGSNLNGAPVSQDILNALTGVSTSTLNQVGSGGSGVNSPTSISNGTPLTLNGKPEILYMGAEYCPYCATERWSLIVALSKFGSFSGLEYMQSSGTDVYSNTPTFSFVHATYTSPYIAFVTVEQQTRDGQPLQTATAEQTSLLTTYDSGGTIPFVDFANKYVVTSAQYLPTVLRVGSTATGAPYNWTQIASQLDNPSSPVAISIDGAANRIISAICKIDGNQPSSVCSESFASTLSYYAGASPFGAGGSQPLLVSDAAGPGAQVPYGLGAGRLAQMRLTS